MNTTNNCTCTAQAGPSSEKPLRKQLANVAAMDIDVLAGLLMQQNRDCPDMEGLELMQMVIMRHINALNRIVMSVLGMTTAHSPLMK